MSKEGDRAFESGLSVYEYRTLILEKQAPWPLNEQPHNPPKRPPGTVVPHPKPID
jgi:hypothetical protein